MIDLKGLTLAELCLLLHDIAEEMAQRQHDLLSLLNAEREVMPDGEDQNDGTRP